MQMYFLSKGIHLLINMLKYPQSKVNNENQYVRLTFEGITRTRNINMSSWCRYVDSTSIFYDYRQTFRPSGYICSCSFIYKLIFHGLFGRKIRNNVLREILFYYTAKSLIIMRFLGQGTTCLTCQLLCRIAQCQFLSIPHYLVS